MIDRRVKQFVVLCTAVAWLGGAVATEAAGARQSTTRGKTSSKTTAAKARTTPTKSVKTRTVKTRSTKTSRAKRTSTARRQASSVRQRRAARLARLRAAQRAREYREVATPLFRLDDAGNMVPDVRAAAAVIYNPVTQQVLWSENADSPRSIASITKVMTAVVLLENEFDLGREITIAPTDVRGARHYYVRSGDVMPVEDVLHLMLIASDNAAAKALARTSAMGYDGFMERMNSKAQELGLESTRYADPSGLDSGNVSSALDMARLIAFASNDERIASIMRKNDYRVTTNRRTLVVHNTNRLIGSEVEVQGGKTGFIRDAGYCLATLLKLPQGDPVAVVVLGARSSAGRFMETRHLFNWVAGKTQQVLGGTPKEQ